MFGDSAETPTTTLQLFEPDAHAVYTLEQAARLTQLPRRLIAVYFKHGLVSPVMDPACSGWYFNDEAIRILRRIDYLRTTCGCTNYTVYRCFLPKWRTLSRSGGEAASCYERAKHRFLRPNRLQGAVDVGVSRPVEADVTVADLNEGEVGGPGLVVGSAE